MWVTDTPMCVLLALEGAFLVSSLKVLGMLRRIDPLRRLVLRRMALLDDPSRDR